MNKHYSPIHQDIDRAGNLKANGFTKLMLMRWLGKLWGEHVWAQPNKSWAQKYIMQDLRNALLESEKYRANLSEKNTLLEQTLLQKFL